MNNKWFQDIMIQKYQLDNYYDPTKILILMAITESGELKERYSISEISKIVYRYYISNIDVAKHNFNITIRNIYKYGVSDIIPVVESSLNQWIKEQKNSSILLSNNFIKLTLDKYDKKTLDLTRKMAKTLFKKYYKVELIKINDYSETINKDDLTIYTLAKSNIKNLIFEDIQFCPITEEIDREKLFVVHLYTKKEGANELDLTSKDNLMLFSEEIALDYVGNKFYFDEFGKVINISSKFVNSKMKLGINYMTNERKKYILKHLQSIKNSSKN